MKKGLFILAAAALVLASCNNDVTIAENQTLADPNQPQEIGFTPLNVPVRRAMSKAPVHGIAMPDQDLYVAAYMAAPNVGNYFEKTVYKKDYAGGNPGAGDNVWGGLPARFWPLSDATINFLAVTGAGIDADHFTFNGSNYANSVAVAYTTAHSYSPTTQSDIMYAVGQGTVTQTNNSTTFAGGGSIDAENVKMTFYHALALLNFQVKANSATEVNKIVVNSITVNGASYTGNLTITNANYAATDATAKNQPTIAWAPSPAVAAVVTGISDYTLASKDDYYPDNSSAWANIMIVPSNTSDATTRGFRSFTINYTIKGNSGQADQTYDYTYYPSGDASADFNVREGKIYTYRINFKLHEIRIEPVVTDWVENGNGSGSTKDLDVL